MNKTHTLYLLRQSTFDDMCLPNRPDVKVEKAFQLVTSAGLCSVAVFAGKLWTSRHVGGTFQVRQFDFSSKTPPSCHAEK